MWWSKDTDHLQEQMDPGKFGPLSHLRLTQFFIAKSAYWLVNTIKGLSGIGHTWDDENGMAKSATTSEWKDYMAVSGTIHIQHCITHTQFRSTPKWRAFLTKVFHTTTS